MTIYSDSMDVLCYTTSRQWWAVMVCEITIEVPFAATRWGVDDRSSSKDQRPILPRRHTAFTSANDTLVAVKFQVWIAPRDFYQSIRQTDYLLVFFIDLFPFSYQSFFLSFKVIKNLSSFGMEFSFTLMLLRLYILREKVIFLAYPFLNRLIILFIDSLHRIENFFVLWRRFPSV